MIRTVLFDLDGTLLDTAPDLAYALNRVLKEQGQKPLPFETIRPVVSHGSTGLLRLGFHIGPEDAGFEPLRRRLLDIYQGHLANETRLFPGMSDVLSTIEESGMSWGVVTNKPGWLTEPLLEQLRLTQRAVCIVSGDSTPRRKPDPEPMLYACQLAGCAVTQCVYVGDAERDIVAGRNAGMKTLVARFGYIGSGDDPERWGADSTVDHPLEILNWIQQQNRTKATLIN
jgi:2-phosphoglycolate phosphatase